MENNNIDFTGKTILVFGGCGFIGSNFIKHLFENYKGMSVINFDALTYSGNEKNLEDLSPLNGYIFIKGNIVDEEAVRAVFKNYKVDYVINFAAETHVDRSIHVGSKEFIDTNITGVYNILEAVKESPVTKYLQVSTDEVYGQLPNPYDEIKNAQYCDPQPKDKDSTSNYEPSVCVDKIDFPHYHLRGVAVTKNQLFDLVNGKKFKESTQFKPNVPYSATKAGGDCLCNAYHHTWGVPVVVTHCSNNYGPYQYPEKLVPFWATRILAGEKIPIYGDGLNIRDWIHVSDHVSGLILALVNGESGRTYNFGADNEKTNLQMADAILNVLKPEEHVSDWVEFVKDRPGHDRRYAIDNTRAREELGWIPTIGAEQFPDKLKETLDWYRDNIEWSKDVIEKTGVANPHIDLWKGVMNPQEDE